MGNGLPRYALKVPFRQAWLCMPRIAHLTQPAPRVAGNLMHLFSDGLSAYGGINSRT